MLPWRPLCDIQLNQYSAIEALDKTFFQATGNTSRVIFYMDGTKNKDWADASPIVYLHAHF